MSISRDLVSLDSPVGVDRDASTIGDFVADTDYQSPEEQAQDSALKDQINKVLATLTEKEADIIVRRFGLNGKQPLSLKEIGAPATGSQGAHPPDREEGVSARSRRRRCAACATPRAASTWKPSPTPPESLCQPLSCDAAGIQLPGLTRREMSTMFPGCVLPADVTDRGWWFHDWEGDRAMLDLAHRNALSFIAHLETHHVAAEQRIALAEGYRAATGMGMETHHVAAEQRIAAILHGGSGSSLVSALFGIPIPAKWERGLNVETASRYARFTHDNAGVSRISITPERRQLRYLNRIDHLNDTALQS